MANLISAEDRKQLAKLVGINEAYLYQCLTGRRDMGALEAVRVEQVSSGKLRRWELCQETWHRIWPELIGSKGAPEPPPREPGNTAPGALDEASETVVR